MVPSGFRQIAKARHLLTPFGTHSWVEVVLLGLSEMLFLTGENTRSLRLTSMTLKCL